MSAQAVPFLTPEEYLVLERAAETRSEYHRGVMLALAGTNVNHGRIVLNLATRLEGAVGDGTCEVFATEIRLWIESEQLYTYPDLMVICGLPATTDALKDAVTNPSTIIEVLSKSTEAYDRGRKFAFYQQVDSLGEYILVSQDEPRVERFVRLGDGSWNLTIFVGLDAVLGLHGGEWRIALADIYRRVSFE